MVMFAPHVLQVRREEVLRDADNRSSSVDFDWETLGTCRCDDSDMIQTYDANGSAFIPKHVIVAAQHDVRAGDHVRALLGETVRGEGMVRKVIRTNYLDYMILYV